METVKNAANNVAESAKQVTSGESKEANKGVAQDSNQDLSTRAGAAKEAVGDKVEEEKHGNQADVHREAAKQ